jgi:capsular polysaccharide biosynthesis protein
MRDLYGEMLLKRLLCERDDARRAFEEARYLLPLAVHDVLELRNLGYLGAAGSAFRRSFEILEPAGEDYVIESPRLIGAAERRSVRSQSRAFYIASFTNARIRARSGVVLAGDMALLDAEEREVALVDDQIEYDPAIFARHSDGRVWCVANESETLDFSEAFVSLLGPWSYHFGHWILEYLPKVATAVASGALPAMPFLVDSEMSQANRDALRFFLPAGFEIVEVPETATVRAARLWCAPSISYRPALEKTNERWRKAGPAYLTAPPSRIARAVDILLAAYDPVLGASPAGSRLYLARPHDLWRKLLNHREIEGIARSFGFEIVYPEQFDFMTQVALVRGAQHIVGPEGSAMFLTFFAREGTTVGIFNHHVTDNVFLYSGVLEYRGLDVTVLCGRTVRAHDDTYQGFTQYADYEIDPARFVEYLETKLGVAYDASRVDEFKGVESP